MILTLYFPKMIKKNFLFKKFQEIENTNKKFLTAITQNNTEEVKLILNHSFESSIPIEINANNDGEYPLLYAIINNNVEMVRFIMDYANANNMILNVNEKDKEGDYPLLNAVSVNNTEMVRLLMEYAVHNHIHYFRHK